MKKCLNLAVGILFISSYLYSQSTVLPKSTINHIQTFEFEDDFSVLDLSIQGDRILVYDASKASNIYVSSNLSSEFKHFNNLRKEASEGLFFSEDCLFSYSKNSIQNHCQDTKLKAKLKSTNPIFRKSSSSSNETILVLDASLKGSTLSRINKKGGLIKSSSFSDDEECSQTPVFREFNESDDGSIYLVGIAVPEMNSNFSKDLIVGNLNENLNQEWVSTINMAESEFLQESILLSNDILLINTVSSKNDCFNGSNRFIGIDKLGNTIFDICSDDSNDESSTKIKSSLIPLENGFVKVINSKSNQNNSYFDVYNNFGEFQYQVLIPIQKISNAKMYENKILITSEQNLYSLDLEFNSKNPITESSIPYNISIYPNPSSGKIYIEWENESFLKIYSALGVFIEHIPLSNGKGVYESGMLNDGVYFIADPAGKHVKRVMKLNKN